MVQSDLPNQFNPTVPFGGQFPTRVVARDPLRRWLVVCQARSDTDGNGVLAARERQNWDGGDELSPFLFLPGEAPIQFDGFLGHEEDGRLVMVSRGHRVLVIDVNTGDRWWLKGSPVGPGDTGWPEGGRICRQRAMGSTDPLVPDNEGLVALLQRPRPGSVEALTIQLEDYIVAWGLESTLPRGPVVWVRSGEQPASYGEPVAATESRSPADMLGVVTRQALPLRFARAPRMTSFHNPDASSTPLADARRQFCRKDQEQWRQWSDARSKDLDFAVALGRNCDQECQDPKHCWTQCDLAEALLAEAAKYEGEEQRLRQNQAGELLAFCKDRERLDHILGNTRLPARIRVKLWLSGDKPFNARVHRALREMLEEVASDLEQDSEAWRRTFKAVVNDPDEAVVEPLLSLDRQFPQLKLYEYFDCSPHGRLRQRGDRLSGFPSDCGHHDAKPEHTRVATSPVDCQHARYVFALRDCLLDRAGRSWSEARTWEAGLSPDRRKLLLDTGQSSLLRAFEREEDARARLAALDLALQGGGPSLGRLLSDEHLIELRGVDPDSGQSVDTIIDQVLSRHVALFDGVRVEPFWRRLDEGDSPHLALNAFFDGKRVTMDLELIARDALTHGEGKRPSGHILWNAAFRFLNAIARERGSNLRFVPLERSGITSFTVLAAPEPTIRELHREGLLTLDPLRDVSVPQRKTGG